MTKAEFVTRVAEISRKTKAETEVTLNMAFQELADRLEVGDQLSWPGFGTFKTVDRAAREGRNPQTGAKIQIPATKAVKFSASQSFRDAINGCS